MVKDLSKLLAGVSAEEVRAFLEDREKHEREARRAEIRQTLVEKFGADWEAKSGLTLTFVDDKPKGSKATKGKSVLPKYRDPEGRTWSGRGVAPKFWQYDEHNRLRSKAELKALLAQYKIEEEPKAKPKMSMPEGTVTPAPTN